MTRCKRLLCAFLALIMCIGILPITSMASDFEDGLDHFAKTAAFTESIFSDVQKEDWFYDNVKSVYEYELMRGKGESRFDPNNSVTLAETITIAARLHAQYHIGMDVFSNSDPWYQTYVDYAADCGIISDLIDEGYDTPATRGEFAAIIARALPDSAFEEINTVAYNGIPDVALSDSYGRAVYKLYRAGIMVGNDENGTFAPDSNIKRCEVAAIVTRMVEPALRQSVRLGEEYTVSFDLGYQGMTLDAQKVVAGYTAAEPKAPTRQNYIFEGWYTAANGGVRFEFDTEIHADMTLYAHWNADPVWWAWIMDEFFDKDKEKPDKPDEPREEYDYGKLPYRPGKTWEELVEINGGEEPYIEMKDNDQVGLYIGRISDNRVEDVYDVIAELNNVRELLNINDARFEFVPYPNNNVSLDNLFCLQQVFNGVQVRAADVIVETDDNGYIIAFMNRYIDYIRFINKDYEFKISEKDCIEILAACYNENVVAFENITLLYNDDSAGMVYDCSLTVDEIMYNIWVDALSGEIISTSVVQPSWAEPVTGYGGYYTYFVVADPLVELRTRYKGVMFDEKIQKNVPLANPNNCTIDHGERTIPSTDEKCLEKVIKNKDAEVSSTVVDSVYDVRNVYNKVVGHDSIDNKGIPVDIFTNAYIGDTFSEMSFFSNHKWNNAVSMSNKLYDLKNDPYPCPVYVMIFGDEHSSLTTVGHEYTHGVQKYVVGYNGKDAGFASAYKDSEQVGANIPWVESHALSEGTADVMGALASCITEQKETISLDDLYHATYPSKAGKELEGKYVSWNPSTADMYNRTYTQLREYYTSDKIGYLFDCGCYILSRDLPYGYGPGHNERYICCGILYCMVRDGMQLSDENNDLVNPERLFKLWYNALCMLNSKSGLYELRYALYMSGLKMKLNSSQMSIIDKACNSVGIEGRNASNYSPWYYNGLSQAMMNNIINSDQAKLHSKILTRREYLDLLAAMCEKVGVNTGSDIVAWAKGLQVIGDEWSGDYLDESIPKWQAALLMYQIFNRYHAGFKNAGYYPIYTYPYGEKDSNGVGTDFYYNFTRYGFEDFGESIPEIINLSEMMQYYPGKDSITAFQQQYMFSHIESINYITGDKDDTNTRNSLYYMGFYQLWRNGMFKGYSSSGKLRLGATDSISLGEACALITQVIPD